MSGIYIHIPYCKQACHYCDFHFSTNLKTKISLINSINEEISIRNQYLKNTPLRSIYFGGGTPSMLSKEELAAILDKIYDTFEITDDVEITLEANPDDLSLEKSKELYELGFNRLSIGIQSFDDKILSFFNRAHTSQMAIEAVVEAKKIGFDNISVDIIFGIPGQSLDQLNDDLDKALALDTKHISIYGLTIEDQTVFGKWLKQKKLTPIDEDLSAAHLTLIMERLEKENYLQYEISNFCKAGFESKHNSSYWQDYHYLGIGPSAHSYNGVSRQFNTANNTKYIDAVSNGQSFFEKEVLSKEDKVNEYILTHIRTSNGIGLANIKNVLGYNIEENKSLEIKMLIDLKMVTYDNYSLKLTRKGKLVADFVTEKLIF